MHSSNLEATAEYEPWTEWSMAHKYVRLTVHVSNRYRSKLYSNSSTESCIRYHLTIH